VGFYHHLGNLYEFFNASEHGWFPRESSSIIWKITKKIGQCLGSFQRLSANSNVCFALSNKIIKLTLSLRGFTLFQLQLGAFEYCGHCIYNYFQTSFCPFEHLIGHWKMEMDDFRALLDF